MAKITPIVTLTQVQEDAINYALRAKRPNDHRVIRKAARMVRAYCEKHAYTREQIDHCVHDMFDMLNLEKLCQ